MNITFFIGNGFDINLGLKTQYKDFYPRYVANNDDMLSRDIAKDFENWADLELGLGSFLSKIDADGITKFLDCKENLEYDLAEYLRKEDARLSISNSGALAKEVLENLFGFYKEFDELANSRFLEDLGSVLWNYDQVGSYNFISFNYTKAFDRIIRTVTSEEGNIEVNIGGKVYKYRFFDPIHIHGTLDNNMILGINDSSQINNADLLDNEALNKYIVKNTVNTALNNQTVERVKRIINGSSYICIYGMSLGETDKLWWSYILEWLKSGFRNRLVIYIHPRHKNNPSIQQKLRMSDTYKQKFYSLTNASEQDIYNIENNHLIITIVGTEVFDFNKVDVLKYQ